MPPEQADYERQVWRRQQGVVGVEFSGGERVIYSRQWLETEGEEEVILPFLFPLPHIRRLGSQTPAWLHGASGVGCMGVCAAWCLRLVMHVLLAWCGSFT
jgi:hypothetical protein